MKVVCALLFFLALTQATGLNATNLGVSACQTKINNFNGNCVFTSMCQGGIYNGLCSGLSKCCVNDPNPVPSIPTAYVTYDQFRSLFKSVSAGRATVLYPWFNRAVGLILTNSLPRFRCEIISAFAAQVGHESADLMLFEELASGSAYEGRCKDLGNCQEGDGVRYKGRGAIQVTGRSNYRRVSDYFKDDFIANPELLVVPSHGFNSAVWYWTVNNLNRFCDGTTDNFKKLTKAINGGYNGLDDRLNRWYNAQKVLGC